ncbi:MAG: 16S rRNA (adenine(1518)-N(6)/adenine(1519)-N(6))-dimethyltransferase RsmA [Bacilli bacterium]
MNAREILENNKFIFKKKYGQNFLLDNNILNNIVEVSGVSKDTLVIEIGVGAGALTKKLSEKSKDVLGYEIDKTLKEPLKQILSKYDNIKVIFDDFLKRNLNSDLENYKSDEIIVVANLPYYITTPIITKFITEKINVKRIVVMVQNEVADRFSAQPGTKNYNSLTIFLNYYFDIKKAFFVSRNVFFPKPNVDSAIVIFDKKQNKIKVDNEEFFFKLVKDAFKQKRKTLKNNLNQYDLRKLEEVLHKFNKTLQSRAESLSIEEFILISNDMNKR